MQEIVVTKSSSNPNIRSVSVVMKDLPREMERSGKIENLQNQMDEGEDSDSSIISIEVEKKEVPLVTLSDDEVDNNNDEKLAAIQKNTDNRKQPLSENHEREPVVQNRNASQEGSASRAVSTFLPLPTSNTLQLRPIIIDGSNVAKEHGKPMRAFSCAGIQLCVDYFVKRGHREIKVFMPSNYKTLRTVRIIGINIMDKFEEQQLVMRASCEGENNVDRRHMLKFAVSNGGIIVSNSNFRNIANENKEWEKLVEERLLIYCFVGDRFMIPDSPLGRNGPHINQYLSFPQAS